MRKGFSFLWQVPKNSGVFDKVNDRDLRSSQSVGRHRTMSSVFQNRCENLRKITVRPGVQRPQTNVFCGPICADRVSSLKRA